MKLVRIENNWDERALAIDLSIGNVCNYKCWYCFPGSNEGNHKFPDYEIFKNNITHLLNYYKANGKEIFNISFVGGEPTHWPKLIDFIQYLKDNFNCVMSMTSNGSKTLEYWQKIAPCFDRIQLSCHHQYVDLEKFRDICDYLYKQNVIVSVSVMMDPNAWDRCLDMVNYLKRSKKRWTIRYVELLGHDIIYTTDQIKLLNKHRARGPNVFWFWKNNKLSLSKVVAIVDDGSKTRMKDNGLLLNRLNNFYGWECSLGVNWIHVAFDGSITGTCGQTLYKQKNIYNLRDENFVKDFNPNIQTTICKQLSCNCMAETNMPKKIIPIYEKNNQ